MIKNIKTASITELRQNATSLINGLSASREPVYILQNSKKVAVLIDDATFQELLSAYESMELEKEEHYIATLAQDGLIKPENEATLPKATQLMQQLSPHIIYSVADTQERT